MSSTPSITTLTLTLNGSHWFIRAGDADAVPVIAALGSAMSLPPASFLPQKCPDEPWREVRVITDSRLNEPQSGYYETGPIFCLLPQPDNHDRLVIGMSLIGLAIARAELSRGGLLIHGALAAAPDNSGGGIILAGPAEVGKTTASNRLPSPWQSLSDDTTLVVRDRRGQYAAHPWPTWSRFFTTGDGKPGPGESSDVQKGLPLRGIYFLKQAKKDSIQLLPTASAVTFLMGTVKLVSSLMTWDLPNDLIKTLHKSQFAAAEELIHSIPAYALHISLTGTFWQNIDETLSQNSEASGLQVKSSPATLTHSPQKHTAVHSLPDAETITVCYSGSSMYPTLNSPDILEVMPYSGKPLRSGDIIYYPSPIDGTKMIHRIVRVTADHIYTRGDNNAEIDPYLLHRKDVIGRVAKAWRYGRCRKITGGTQGIYSGYWGRIRSRINKSFSPILHGIYHRLASSGILYFFLPATIQPRVFEFKQRYQPAILKLMVKGHVIGHYDVWRKLWMIDRPWKLILDESKLPVISRPDFMENPPQRNAIPEERIVS